MTELLMVLAVIFVAYLYFGHQKEPQSSTSSPHPSLKPEKSMPVAANKRAAVQALAKTEKTPAKKTAAASIKPAKAGTASKAKPVASQSAKTAETKPKPGKPGLKDPKTGEIATSYSNYRFTKRWIKEALVAEGLLDKIYKNDELTADIETNIKSAMVKLESIKKYRA